MFQRILIPLDGSSNSERALPVAARIARACGGTLILLQAVPIPIESGSHILQSSPLTRGTLAADIDAARHYLDTLAHSDDLNGIAIKMRVLPGNPTHTILDTAKTEQADLIVMCSHGDSGFQRWLLGSVAQRVARHSPAPVLVLRKGGTLPTSSYPDRLRPLRALMALVALDGSDYAETALVPAARLVAALAAPARGILLLTKVVNLPVNDNEQGYQEHLRPRMDQQALYEAKSYLCDVANQLNQGEVINADLTVTWSIAVGNDIADALIRAAENAEDVEGIRLFGSCDLIVLATHGREGLQRWVMDSVTERVLGATKLPILIVPPQASSAPYSPADRKASTSRVKTSERPIV
jgi:nucleotide-binding universal stress UspA family protein